MSYVLGYVVADGCVFKDKSRENSFIFNITSKDKTHLEKIKKIFKSQHKISIKPNGVSGFAYQFQVRNNTLCKDLEILGILPRKTYNLQSILTPKKYFADFVRGFFDGDGSVYIYKVNSTYQIKIELVSVSRAFVSDLNTNLCKKLNIPLKNIHENVTEGKMTKYSIVFYISDSEKFYKFVYQKNTPIYLTRKKKVFEKWYSLIRRNYVKKINYPSKIGWHLNSSFIK